MMSRMYRSVLWFSYQSLSETKQYPIVSMGTSNTIGLLDHLAQLQTPAKTRWIVAINMDYIELNKGPSNYSCCTVYGIFITDLPLGLWLLVWGMHFLSILSITFHIFHIFTMWKKQWYTFIDLDHGYVQNIKRPHKHWTSFLVIEGIMCYNLVFSLKGYPNIPPDYCTPNNFTNTAGPWIIFNLSFILWTRYV